MLDKNLVNTTVGLIETVVTADCVTYNALFNESQCEVCSTPKQLINQELEELSVEFSIPAQTDFTMRIYADHIEKNYGELKTDWDFFTITLSVSNDICPDTLYEFLLDIQAINEYPDFTEIDGYYDEYQSEHDEALNDYGLDDFVENIKHYIHTLYPTAYLSDLYEHKDSKWVLELFYLCLEGSFFEYNTLVFNHKLDNHEDRIISDVEYQLQEKFSDAYIDNINMDEIATLQDDIDLYLAMPVKDFTLNQLANIIYLQKNKKWSDDNLVFISGYGYYVKISKYSYNVMASLETGKVLDHKTLKEITVKLSHSQSAWHHNWQKAIKSLSKIEGLEFFSNHYKHGDKYDTIAKELFYKLVDCHPELCSLSGNWWSLKVDTKIIPDKNIHFDRHNRNIDEFIIDFDIKTALKQQELISETFTDNLKWYINHRMEQLQLEIK